MTTACNDGLVEDAPGEPVPLSEDGSAAVPVPAAGLATIKVVPAVWPAPLAGPALAGPALPESALPESAQPVFARYWLHGKGPAPAGNMPVAVHLSPPRLAVTGPQGGQLRLTVACGPDRAAGEVELVIPAGLDVVPPGPLSYDLGARGHASWELTVTPRPGAAAGHRFVAARIRDGLGQLVEDAVLIVTGRADPAGPAGDRAADLAELAAISAEVDVTLGCRELTLRPGRSAALEVGVVNHAAGAIRGEVQLISPAGSWACLPRWATGFSAGPGESATLSFPVTAPADARSGQRWWVIAKVMYFGRARYSEPVEVLLS